MAILFEPLTWLGDTTAVLVWLALRIGMLVLTCALMPVSRPIRLAIFGVAALSEPVLFDLNLGNISLLVTFAAVLAWRWRDRPVAGAALAGALALRPTMALIGAWWLMRGVWRPVIVAAGVGLVIVAASLPFVGVGALVRLRDGVAPRFRRDRGAQQRGPRVGNADVRSTGLGRFSGPA